MDKLRFGLWFGLLASLFLAYQQWLLDNQPEPTATTADTSITSGDDDELPPLEDDPGALPELDAPVATPDGSALPATDDTSAPDRTVRVTTDVLELVIDLDGGDIVRADIPTYPVDKANPDVPIRLLDYTAANRWVFETGLRSATGAPEPNHQQAFSAESEAYTLAEGQETLEVRLDWTGAGGVSGQKIYTFRRGEYIVNLELVLENGSGETWRGAAYGQMTRVHNPVDRTFLNVDTYSFTGPVIYDGNEKEKIKFDDLAGEPRDLRVVNGWLASIQHHFLAAIVPRGDEEFRLQARTAGNRYRLTAIAPVESVANGATLRYPLTLFVGPKLQDQLDAAAAGRELKLTVDYGVLTVLSQPLFWVLDLIHGWVGNWGWSIILTTLLIKLAFYKLTATSGRSMAKMRKIAPRMKALQEKHKDDRQALSQAMMDLYKKEKVNPAAGCLPILIQMPFFFAFYWVLIESVEMRQAPFALWLNDLSVRDPFFILPLLMGGAMLFQMRLNPAPPDPVQARVMQIMPILFTAMFAWFPSGLVLYWFTNTLVSIAQQWRINQLVTRES